jgi:hypothetical protein
VKHVFVVTLHGPGGDGTWASTAPASYLRDELAPKGTLLTAHHAVAHGELANLVALVGGQPPNASTRAGCPTYAEFPASSGTGSDGTVSGDGCLYPVTALTLPDQLTIAGKTWHAYVEDEDALPGGQQTCRRPAAGTADPTQQPRPTDQYALRHNPFAFFHSLLDLGDCQTNDVTLAELHADLAEAKTTPNLTWITPDVCHDGTEPTCPDGTPGGQAGSDAFLREWVPKILDSAAYKADGLLLVLFTDGAAGDDEGGGGRAGALLVSQWTKAGATDATAIDHYGLLRTIEDLFGLDPLGKAASATGLGTNVLGDVGLPPAAD